MEIWKDIKGHSGAYQVSSYGRVKNKETGHVMSQSRRTDGYLKVKLLYGKIEYAAVHRLVANAFCAKKDDCDEVNHLDRNKENNNADNLEWCTHVENMRHAFANGCIPVCPKKTPVVSVDKVTGERKGYQSVKKAAEAVGVIYCCIVAACQRRAKTCAGLLWEYSR